MATKLNVLAGLDALPKMSLFDVDLNLFPNSRNEGETPQRTFELMDSINRQGLGSAPVIGATPDGSKGAVSGFRRLLAIRWIAVADLFKEANKGKKASDDDYLDIRKPEHHELLKTRNSEAYTQAVKDMMVPYVLAKVTGKQHAAVLNFIENYQREDLSPRDTCNRITTILSTPDDDGKSVKAADLARKMSCSESKISQWKKLGGLNEYLAAKLVTPDVGETLSEDQLAQIKTEAKALLEDYDLRFGLKEGPQAIDFQHARELSNWLMPTGNKTPPTRAVSMGIMEKFLGWQKSTNALDPKRATPELSVLVAQIKNELHKAGTTETEAGTVEGTEGANETPVSELTGAAPATAPVATVSAEETRLQQAEAEAGVANAATGTVVNAGVPTGTPMANATTTPTATATATSTVTAEDAAATGGGVNAPPRKTKAGQEMPASGKYTAPYTTDEIEAFAVSALQMAFEEEDAPSAVMYMTQASASFEVLKSKDEQKNVDTVMGEYIFELSAYIKALEAVKDAAIAANLPVKGIKLKELTLPKMKKSKWITERLAAVDADVASAMATGTNGSNDGSEEAGTEVADQAAVSA